MLEMEYLKEILQTIGDTRYEGINTDKLIESKTGKCPDNSDFLKFKYHMDEMWDAGLIKGRNEPGNHKWGYQYGLSDLMIINVPLVLTPVGSELLAELKKPKGLERLKQAFRSVAGIAGSEALRAGVGELLKSAM